MTAEVFNKYELADYLRVNVGWVIKATTARILPISWVGKHARYRRNEIDAWLKGNTEAPTGKATDKAAGSLALVYSIDDGPDPRPSPPPAPSGPPPGPAPGSPPPGPKRGEAKRRRAS